jgi:hypothetical protein
LSFNSKIFLCSLASSKGESDRIRIVNKTKENFVLIRYFLHVDYNSTGDMIFFELRFLDNLKILNMSIEKLSNLLSDEEMMETKSEFPVEDYLDFVFATLLNIKMLLIKPTSNILKTLVFFFFN